MGMNTRGIVYCDECGNASGFNGERPPLGVLLQHDDECLYLVEDYVMWDASPTQQHEND